MKNIFARLTNIVTRTGTALILGAFFWLAFIYAPPFVFTGILLGILTYIITFELTTLFPVSSGRAWLILPWYPIVPFAMLIYLNHYTEYRSLLFMLFIIISSLDTGSYLVGSLFGRHLIMPSVSPHKSWEGFIGGYIFACVGVLWIMWEMNAIKPWWFIMSFTLIVCVLGLLGDLFESWLKRMARVKDSGDILPGHGGFLDRFDGFLFAVFFFFLLRNWLIVCFKG